MPATYVHERQIEYWTSRAIEDFFRDSGFQCQTFPVDQHAERHLPADFVFTTNPPLKLFGVQFKALYHNGQNCWHLTDHQHETLQDFDWIYYGLSDLKNVRDYRNSLHALRLKGADFPFVDELAPTAAYPYRRWWSFYELLIKCQAGRAIRSTGELRSALSGDNVPTRIIEEIVDVFLVDTTGRNVWHISPFLRQNPG